MIVFIKALLYSFFILLILTIGVKFGNYCFKRFPYWYAEFLADEEERLKKKKEKELHDETH